MSAQQWYEVWRCRVLHLTAGSLATVAEGLACSVGGYCAKLRLSAALLNGLLT